MRPTPGGESADPRSRKASSPGSSATTHSSSSNPAHGPTTFFLASQSEVDKSTASSIPHLVETAFTTDASEPLANTLRARRPEQGPDSTLNEEDCDTSVDAIAEGQERTYGGLAFQRLVGIQKRLNPATSTSLNITTHAEADEKDGSNHAHAGSEAVDGSPLADHHRDQSRISISQPLTPLITHAPSPFDSGLPGTPRSGSVRLSDDDMLTEDGASQVIVSSDEEGEVDTKAGRTIQHRAILTESTPQFVMPSIAMPARRPFTALGRRMPRLKVCVVGAKGGGKTSLIKAILQQCEHIVHVDSPMMTSTKSLPASLSVDAPKPDPSTGSMASHITEYCASTKAYPPWWTDMEEGRGLRRRKSMEDVILERNLCFIDTPGLDEIRNSDQVFDYVESQMERNFKVSALDNNELMNMMTGAGGSQVDLILFVLSQRSDLPKDIETIKRLSQLTNVLPVIGKADNMTTESIRQYKVEVLEEIQSCSAKPFLLGHSVQDLLKAFNSSEPGDPSSASFITPDIGSAESQAPGSAHSALLPNHEALPALAPLAISAMPDSDDAEMDASLLMSPTYIPPLVPSELSTLITKMLDPDTIPLLRHSAVRKLLAWRNEHPTTSARMAGEDHIASERLFRGRTKIDRSMESSQGTLVRTSHSSIGLQPLNLGSAANLGAGLSDFARARLRDHTLREERSAQIQLARWQSDLQRAMKFEREQFESVVHGERASWLLSRLGEEVNKASIGIIDAEGITHRLPTPVTTFSAGQYPSNSGGSGRHTHISSVRSPKREAMLPSWARHARKGASSRRQAVGNRGLGASIKSTTSTILKVVGGSFIVTAAYFAIVGAFSKANTSTDREATDWRNPAWLIDLMGSLVWPGEPQDGLWV